MQIFQTIISFDSVFVVNYFVTFQWSSEMLHHYPNVFSNPTSLLCIRMPRAIKYFVSTLMTKSAGFTPRSMVFIFTLLCDTATFCRTIFLLGCIQHRTTYDANLAIGSW